MKRYSRCNEDEFLDRYFGELATGFFVDIGANDGVTNSNTRRLFDKGWNGVAVEACLNTYCELSKNYQNQDRVRVVHAAITDKIGTVIFYENKDKPFWELNSAHEPWAKRLLDEHHVEQLTKVTVPSLRLRDLCLPPEFNFLSVDTEGGDWLILQQLNDSIQPKLVCAELDKFDYAERIRTCMKDRGYRHVMDIESNGFWELL